ncbi:protein kinase [Streptomyces sp. NPDC001544]|uniref:serine/threonine-protein kinase n=1 Tax=Streptomyces sp. NPDC001544 TaxID=3364584 RepID=UPI0036A703D8
MTKGQDGERVVAARYRLLRRLGAGGMGRVWLAHDQKLDCDVAIKEIAMPGDLSGQELSGRIARARNEAQHAARLRNHPHVATVHDVVEDGGLPWIVMGYLPGATDLKEWVREHGPLSVAETARIGLAVLDALEAGHRIGILHRDVKPANVLLAGESPQKAPYGNGGRVLLVDYGISLRPESGESRLTGTSEIVGTPGFLAPERARGAPPTPASDLFSLGATLYYAVQGTGPFDRLSDVSTLTALLFEDPPPPELAGDLAPVLLGLMAKDPAQRMNAEEAMRQLAACAVPPAATSPPYQHAAPTTVPLPSPDESLSSPAADTPPTEQVPSRAEPPPQPPRKRARKTPSPSLIGRIAGVLLLVGGGLWAGSELLNRQAPHTGQENSAMPYGAEVGLTRELHPGDCVAASWPAQRFQKPPKLKVVDCKTYPDGQVLDVNTNTASLSEATTDSPGICVGLLRNTVRDMVDVQSYALVPSAAAWNHGVRTTACLLFGKTVGLYGPVGRYRHEGDQIFVENSSISDCYNMKKLEEHNYAHLLTDCGKPHDLQGLGYVRAPAGMKFDAWDAFYGLCVKRYGSLKSPTRDLYAWNHAEDTWRQGFHFVMCLLSMPQAGDKLPPGSVQPATVGG